MTAVTWIMHGWMKIRAAMASGELTIEPEKIARALVRHIFEY